MLTAAAVLGIIIELTANAYALNLVALISMWDHKLLPSLAPCPTVLYAEIMDLRDLCTILVLRTRKPVLIIPVFDIN